MSIRTWRVQPLYTIIAEILDKKGSMTDTDLLKALQAVYKDISFNDLNKTLMRMEIAGKIHVSMLMKGKRLVELRKR